MTVKQETPTSILNRVAKLHPDIVAWRRHLHAHPEVGFDEHRTSAFVAERLREFGCDEVVTGIGQTGVVGVINGKKAANDGKTKVIGLRADMDALPLTETTGLPHASMNNGVSHGCGHDGHTAMLLGAARYLAETRDFAGTAVMIFQPAEEIVEGAAAMIEDGLMDRFGIEEVYGMHQVSGMPLGTFSTRQGPMMSSTDQFDIRIEGRGGHACRPQKTIDPIMAGAQLITALQQIVSRNVASYDWVDLSICTFQAGNAHNVIPQTAELKGSFRTMTSELRELVKRRLAEIVSGVAQSTGAQMDLTFRHGCPVTVNHPAQTELAIRVAMEVVGEDNVVEAPAELGAEDFAYMAEMRPGSYVYCGNGGEYRGHSPIYDFNDDAIPYGTSFWIRLVETALPA